MKIAFGYYTFKLKTYTAADLNLNAEQWGTAQFEIRQKVFHIFWLPIFSLGKVYAVRKQGRLFDIAEPYISAIKAKGRVRTPWYAFLVPILAIVLPILGGIYILIAEAIMRRNHFEQDKTQYELVLSDTRDKLANLSNGAYLRIVNPVTSNNRELLFLKVIAVNGPKYGFEAWKVNFPQYSTEEYFFEKHPADTVYFSKGELETAVCGEYRILHDRKPYGVNFLGTGKSVITSIEYFDKPVITPQINWEFWDANRRTNFSYQQLYRGDGYEISLNLQNFGAAAKLVEIKNLENNIKWLDSLPIQIEPYEYLQASTLKGKTTTMTEDFKFKSLLIFKDSLNRRSDYIIEGTNNFYSVKPVNRQVENLANAKTTQP